MPARLSRPRSRLARRCFDYGRDHNGHRGGCGSGCFRFGPPVVPEEQRRVRQAVSWYGGHSRQPRMTTTAHTSVCRRRDTVHGLRRALHGAPFILKKSSRLSLSRDDVIFGGKGVEPVTTPAYCFKSYGMPLFLFQHQAEIMSEPLGFKTRKQSFLKSWRSLDLPTHNCTLEYKGKKNGY